MEQRKTEVDVAACGAAVSGADYIEAPNYILEILGIKHLIHRPIAVVQHIAANIDRYEGRKDSDDLNGEEQVHETEMFWNALVFEPLLLFQGTCL